MQTVLTHMVLTNAHVKWDTSAMDAHVQVILNFLKNKIRIFTIREKKVYQRRLARLIFDD